MSLKYAPSSEPLNISVKLLFLNCKLMGSQFAGITGNAFDKPGWRWDASRQEVMGRRGCERARERGERQQVTSPWSSFSPRGAFWRGENEQRAAAEQK